MYNNEKSTPKDFFLNLLAIIGLYIGSGSLITLLFQYINLLFPDILHPDYYESITSAIRYAMASLIIIFPTYLSVSYLINKDFLANPEKREIRIRKWLIYLTLFVAAIAIIVDLITLVYNFLGGDLSSRFTLKVLVVLAVAGVIFSYYIRDLRNSLTPSKIKFWAWTMSLVILISIAGGFFTAGSPFKARLYNFDQQKISDLQSIQSGIINYWINKQTLPPTLDDLKDSISGFKAPKDPQTNQVYGYNITGKLSFDLCASFNLPTLENFEMNGRSGGMPSDIIGYYKSPYQENWRHGKDSQCFEREIDPDLYQKDNPIPKY